LHAVVAAVAGLDVAAPEAGDEGDEGGGAVAVGNWSTPLSRGPGRWRGRAASAMAGVAQRSMRCSHAISSAGFSGGRR
jgi:hypothetical protein